MLLSELRNNERAFVCAHQGSHALRLRLQQLGFIEGQEVQRLYASPLGSPIVFSMLGQRVALRKSEASRIVVTTANNEDYHSERAFRTQHTGQQNTDFSPQGLRQAAQQAAHTLLQHKAASCATNNCGTCISCAPKPKLSPKQDNTLTIALVGNPNCGKTTFFNNSTGGHERTGNYAGVTVAIAEGETTIKGRQLRLIDLPGTYSLTAYSPEEAYVAAELLKGEIDMIINILDANNLERHLLLTQQLRTLGLPMLGVLNLWDEFEESGSSLDLARLTAHTGLHFIPCVASQKKGISEILQSAIEIHDLHRQLTNEADMPSEHEFPQQPPMVDIWQEPDPNPHAHESQNPHALIRHYLSGIYHLKEGRAQRITRKIDRWLAHSPVAYLVFFAVMWLIFKATFTLGKYPMNWINSMMDFAGKWAIQQLPESWISDLIKDGIFGGVGSVIVFLPNILILYFFIAILEDTGYMARAAFLFDPLLRKVGLHGKSFFPMITGFGCNVPAVMATRIVESFKSRVLTMVTLPFMSCSARIPIYVIFVGAFFPDQAATITFLLYVGGIGAAFLSAWLISRCFRKGDESHFVMEMPPYRRPLLSGLLKLTWEKGRQYLYKMGGLILATSIAIWFLGYFPRTTDTLTPAQQQEQSYLGQLGHSLSPIISPLGFDWRMGVGILTGMGTKELMVSTLGVLYDLDEDTAAAAGNDEDPLADMALQNALRTATTPAAALAYVVFALLYFPCVATIIAIKGESGRWRYALFSAIYSTLFAYCAAWIAYRLMSL